MSARFSTSAAGSGPLQRGGDDVNGVCSACGADVDSDDRFCRRCGASLRPEPNDESDWRSPAGVRALGVILLASVAVVAFVLYGERLGREEDTPSQRIPIGAVSSSPDGSAQPMTPREAADHLFNQAMRGAESGDSVSARATIDMALTAYRGLPALDPDARYHVALLHLVGGRPDRALAHADTLLQRIPEHLLALYVAAEAERQRGRPDRAAEYYRRFLDAHDPEVEASRPEYLDHRGVFRREIGRAREFLEAR